jgi:hypothetical protein
VSEYASPLFSHLPSSCICPILLVYPLSLHSEWEDVVERGVLFNEREGCLPMHSPASRRNRPEFA